MCGRYAATSRPEDLVEDFDIEQVMTGEPSRSLLSAPQDPPPGAPDYNVAPTKQAPVVLTRAPRSSDASYDEGAPPVRQLRLLTWGLVPSWAKDVKVGLRMINARAESVLEKSAFAKAAASRRALVPATGWYEWQVSPTATDARGKPRKQPFFIHHADGSPLAMAAPYRVWRGRARHGCPVGVVAGPQRPGQRRPGGVADDLHHHHHGSRAGTGPHPRPPAVGPRARGLGRLARSAPDGPGPRPRPPGLQPSRPLRRLSHQQCGELLTQQRPPPARARGAGRPRRGRRPHDR